MSISFNKEKNIITIETLNTRYDMQIVKDRYLMHLYYGKRENAEVAEYKQVHRAFALYNAALDDKCFSGSAVPDSEKLDDKILPDTCMSEYVGFDSGDFRTSSLKVKNANGDSAVILNYCGFNILKGRISLEGLPFAEAEDTTETLEISMRDELTGLSVKLYYTVFEACDVISRYAVIENSSENALEIQKCMSLTLDLPTHGYDMISLYGGHGKERNYQRNPLMYGSQSVFSRRGASSHHFNPFIALCDKTADETSGNVYGFNFVYSGNFLDEVEVDQTGGTRVQIGLGSENFSWLLNPGESFTTPEAVMTYSESGIGQMSRNFHKFTRDCILPPEPFEKRPVVLNTWEACYFEIDEAEMLRFAKTAAECGIDMVVMDDGWFGARNGDNAGLGDWYVNRNKFKDGLKPFVEKMKAYGIKFGIWVEPEMVNPDSDLYRAHPEWCLGAKGRELMFGRNQLVLDMGNSAVVDYLKKSFSDTFDGIPIDYFKWDMNRHMSQVGSGVLPAERQGEAAYRYMLGVYELFRWFREKYPNAMIENCSGGGGRYDLGMMKYSTMIWTSDQTWCKDRIKIQYSSLLAYPAATMSCHVANLAHCEVPKQLKYTYDVALGGPIGYELHLPNASQQLRDSVKREIEDYRKYEALIIRGDYYSLYNPFETNYTAYYYTDEKRDRILLSFIQQQPEEPQEVILKVSQAESGANYLDEVSGELYSGEALNRGIAVKSVNEDWNSRLWYLVKQ